MTIYSSSVLEILKDGKWRSTADIVRMLGYRSSSEEHTQVRTLLQKMANSGKLRKSGRKSFFWQITEGTEVPPAETEDPTPDEASKWVLLPAKYREGTHTLKAVQLVLPIGTSGQLDRQWIPKTQYKNLYGDLYITQWLAEKKGYSREDDMKSDYGETPQPKVETPARPEPGIKSEEFKALRNELTILKHHVDSCESSIQSLVKENNDLKDEIKDARRSVKEVKIQIEDVEIKIKNVTFPKYFDEMLDLAKCGQNILLVGPAGCGKTYAAALLAKVLDRRYGSVSCTSGMSESHLTGKGLPNIQTGESVFQNTDFLRCFEEGGVFLLDEMDAADPNMLLCFNSALANGYCNVPNRPKKARAEKHNAFVCVGAANTFGRGADRAYAGRNALDEASLDRFRIGLIEVDYDPEIERQVCPDDELRTRIQAIREKVDRNAIRRVISTRFLESAYIMKSAAGWDDTKIIKKLTTGWKPDELMKIA